MSRGKVTRLTREIASQPADWADLVGRLRACGKGPVFYWERPSSGIGVASLGSVCAVTAEGPGRFDDAAAHLTELASSVDGRVDGGIMTALPLVVGGFGFSDRASRDVAWSGFEPLRFVVPRVMWVKRGESVRTVFTWEEGGEALSKSLLADATKARPAARVRNRQPAVERMLDSEDAAAWTRRARRVLDLIERGSVAKVVLARERSFVLDDEALPDVVLARLRAGRSHCASFWMSGEGSHFIGSSPESLVRVENGRLSADALAGSAERGSTPARDDELGDALLASLKDRREHALVVDAITEAVGPLSSSLEVQPEPEVLRLPEALHLRTRVSARINRPLAVLEAASNLHPTPAVCGVPTDAARRLIDDEEPWRGWYTGAVGWLAAGGEGEFSVALRAALLAGDKATTWAGAGIVEGSEPHLELEEVECKMLAMRSALDGAADVRAA